MGSPPHPRNGMLALVPPAQDPPGDDATLMQAHRDGDPHAFEVIYARHYDGAVRYAWRMLRRREEAEEICTEVFLALYEGAWESGTLRGFLFTLVHHRCVDRIRRRDRANRLLQWIPWQRQQASSSPEDAVAASQQQRHLEAAIGQLSQPHRAALLLYYGQELSSRETAEILGCSDQEVRSRLSYARKKLRTLLKEDLRGT